MGTIRWVASNERHVRGFHAPAAASSGDFPLADVGAATLSDGSARAGATVSRVSVRSIAAIRRWTWTLKSLPEESATALRYAKAFSSSGRSASAGILAP